MNFNDLILTSKGIRFQGRLYPCSIGRGGIRRNKHEGDGATPAGCHHLIAMYYRPDRIPPPADWAQPIAPGDLWSDDPSRPDYNQPVRLPYSGSHEVMRRADPLYDLVIVTDWNYPIATPGHGSCIFVHQWRRPRYPTEGCIAFHRNHLHQIAGRIRPGARLIIPDRP